MSSNTETFVIKLKDQFSKKIREAGETADKTKSKINGLSSVMGKLGGILGAVSVGIFAKKILDLGVDMEQTRVAFETFIGDGKKATKLIADLNQFSNVTPFNNGEIIKSGRILLSAGIKSENIVENLRMIGDVSAGAKVPITELSAIFQKATNKGKIQAEELNQFSERGIPLLSELAKNLNLVDANSTEKEIAEAKSQVMKLGSQGKLTSQIMNDAFRTMTSDGGVFFNLMKKQSETTGGKISTLVGKLQTIGIAIGEAVLPVVSVMTDIAIAIVSNMDLLENLGIVVGGVAGAFAVYKAIMLSTSVVASATAGIQSVLALATAGTGVALKGATFWTKIATVSQWAWNVALSMNPIGLVVIAIAGLVTALVLAWKNSETFRATIWGLWEAMKTVGDNIAQYVIKPLNAFVEIWNGLGDLFNGNGADGLISGIKNLGTSILTYILQPFLQLTKVIDEIAGTEFAPKLKAFTGIDDFTEGIGESFKKGFDGEIEKSKREKEKENAVNSGTVSGTGLNAVSGVTTGTSKSNKSTGLSEIKTSAPKVFNINIGSLIKEQSINTTNLTESSQKIKTAITEALLTAVNDSQIISS